MISTVVITSKKDIASLNIRDKLLNLSRWEKTQFEVDRNPVLKNKNSNVYLVLIERDLIYSDYINKELKNLKPRRLIFASRHASQTKKPSLHVHYTGNWNDENIYGGEPRALSIAEPIAAREAFLRLYYDRVNLNSAKFEASLEVTHHGPTELDYPLFFIELGSSEEQWKLDDAAELLARIILDVAELPMDTDKDTAIGFGGPHYAPSFTRYMISNDILISHITPKYHIDLLDIQMVEKMIDRSFVKPNIALIDWKGLKSVQRKKVLKFAEEKNLEVIKI